MDEKTKVSAIVSEQLLHPRGTEGVMDALSDPASDVLKEIVDEIADLAKERLRKEHGLPPEEMRVGPLPKTGKFAQAKTLEELGMTEADVIRWDQTT